MGRGQRCFAHVEQLAALAQASSVASSRVRSFRSSSAEPSSSRSMPVSAGLEPGRRRSVSCRGATLSLIDIDALKHHVNEAERARGEAERANLAKDEFLATLSHEIRTPLSSMLMHAQLLGRGDLDPVKIKRAADAIERGTRMQVRLVDDLLDVSRIAAGKLQLDWGPSTSARSSGRRWTASQESPRRRR